MCTRPGEFGGQAGLAHSRLSGEERQPSCPPRPPPRARSSFLSSVSRPTKTRPISVSSVRHREGQATAPPARPLRPARRRRRAARQSSSGSCRRMALSRRRSALLGSRPSSSPSDGPQILVGPERLGLAAGPVEGKHPLGPEAFPQGMRPRQSVEFGHQCAVAAAGQVGLDAVLQGGEPGFLQADGLGPGHRRFGHVGQGRAPPQAEGLPQGRRRLLAWSPRRPAPGPAPTSASKRMASTASGSTRAR